MTAPAARSSVWLLVALWLIFAFAIYVRTCAMTLYGQGDYLLWANQSFFGPITSIYMSLADELMRMKYAILNYPPGYPAFLAFLKAIGIADLQHMRLVQAVIDSVGTFLAFNLLIRTNGSRFIGLIAAFIYACYPIWVVGSVILLAEFISPLYILAALNLILWCNARGNYWCYAVTGFVLALGVLFRPDLLFLPAVLAAWTALMRWRDRGRGFAVILLVGFAIPIALWGTYNRIQHGHWVFTTTSGGAALWEGLGELPNDYGYILSDAKAGEMLQEKGLELHSVEADRYMKSEYLKAWIDHPGFVLRVIAVRWKNILVKPEAWMPELELLPRFHLALAKLGPLLVLVSVLLFRKSAPAVLIVLLPAGYALISIGLTHWEPRYVRYVHLSYVFALLFLLAWFIDVLSRGWKRSRIVAQTVIASTLLITLTPSLKQMFEYIRLLRNAPDFSLERDRDKLTGGYDLCSLEFVPADTGVTFASGSCELDLTTSRSRYGYQIEATVAVPKGSIVHVAFTGQLLMGAIEIGVLAKDRRRWIAQTAVERVDDFSKEIVTTPSLFDKVTIMIANSSENTSKVSFDSLQVRCFPTACGPARP